MMEIAVGGGQLRLADSVKCAPEWANSAEKVERAGCDCSRVLRCNVLVRGFRLVRGFGTR